ncbi:TPA: undecaprenyl-phosphate glucose phosphotransferase, partial [Klebsiella quasipneumoniae]|nr:undecaprenyl-phosphate glucose phosphotransferase [Klebsiella quasipneumoniae subsp. similipneumoniae]HCM6425909.1 undecaprenyl-phosphate glucose phosphotransferase [Klebsiella quasipneumoniae]
MTDSKIKIYSTRYSNIMKLLDFFSVNIFIYVYLIVLNLVPTPSSILLGIIYSLIFIRTNEYFQLYSGQMKGRYLSILVKLFISACLGGLLSFLLIVIAEQLASRPLSIHHLVLAKTIALCSVAVFISMFFIRVVTSRYFFKSKRRVAILGITPAGLAILQELHKEFSAEGIDIRFYEDRAVQRDSRLINIDKAGNSRDLLALAKKGEVDEVYIAL